MEVEFKPNNSNGENIPIIEADSHEIEEKTEEVFSDKTPEKKEINNLKLSFVEWIKFTEDKTVNVEKKVLGDKKSPLQDKLSIINQFIEYLYKLGISPHTQSRIISGYKRVTYEAYRYRHYIKRLHCRDSWKQKEKRIHLELGYSRIFLLIIPKGKKT